MKSIDEKIRKVLEGEIIEELEIPIESSIVKPIVKEISVVAIVPEELCNTVSLSKESLESDIAFDYDKSRKTLRGLLDNGNSALLNLIELAEEVESPRAYEVVGNMIKNLGDISKDLIDLQLKIAELNRKSEEYHENGVNNIQNAVFVGSTKDLQDAIKESHKKGNINENGTK